MAESKPTLKASVESNTGANDATLGPPLAAVFHTSPSAETAGYADRDHDPLPAPGGFVIENQIGVGGMGVVYLAHQQGLNREVAIKTVWTGCGWTK